MKVRLKDLAAATGFSVNTVSHALRDKPDISAETKKIIRKAAEQFGYIPNLQASSIRSGKSHIVAIILPDIVNPHFTIVFRELEHYFNAINITPIFLNTNEDPEKELRAVRVAISQSVDGILLCPTQHDAECIRLLESAKIPYVLIGRRFAKGPDTDYVICDDENGGYLATKHLISMGHREIACVRVNDIISSDRERFSGYLRALEEDDVPLRDDLILNLSLTDSDNSDAIRQFLTAHPECTAVLSFNDILAYHIIREANRAGKRVPEDLSVIGFDNICSDYPLPIPLSSVSVSKKTMARIASELLLKLINEGSPADAKKTHVVLPTRLFLRDTIRRVPGQ